MDAHSVSFKLVILSMLWLRFSPFVTSTLRRGAGISMEACMHAVEALVGGAHHHHHQRCCDLSVYLFGDRLGCSGGQGGPTDLTCVHLLCSSVPTCVVLRARMRTPVHPPSTPTHPPARPPRIMPLNDTAPSFVTCLTRIVIVIARLSGPPHLINTPHLTGGEPRCRIMHIGMHMMV